MVYRSKTSCKIEVRGGKFLTKNYFKPTDRNSYLPLDSCHHMVWLTNIPKGQFTRLRRNCSRRSDFLVQSELLGKRFIDKGCNRVFIKQVEKLYFEFG